MLRADGRVLDGVVTTNLNVGLGVKKTKKKQLGLQVRQPDKL